MSPSELASVAAAAAAGERWVHLALERLQDERAESPATEAPATERDSLFEEMMDEDMLSQAQMETAAVYHDPEEQDEECSFTDEANLTLPADDELMRVAGLLDLDSINIDILSKDTACGKDSDSKSTRSTYRRVHKVYTAFLAQLEASSESPVDSLSIFIPDQQFDYVNRKLVRLFVIAYVRHTGHSSTHYLEACNFMQRLLEDEMAKKGVIPNKGIIKADKYLKDFEKDVHVMRAKKERESGADLQEHLDSQISREEELRLVDICYDPRILRGMSYIAKSNVVSGYLHSAQVGTRGSDTRGVLMNHCFIRRMDFLGKGELVDNLLLNQGKTNRVGRIEYKAFATHVNPRMDASAHLGMNMLLRFAYQGEPFPDFLDIEDYAKRPVFRSAKSYLRHYPPTTQYRNWKSVFDASGITCNKVTHQQRGQVQQKLSDKGCPLDTLERFMGYAGAGQKEMNKNQKDSYLFTPPVQPVCGAADGDPNHPELHSPAWDIDLLPNELSTLCPWLYKEIEKIDKAFDQFPKHADRKKKCLIQARGCLASFQQRIGQAVKMLASLPMNDRNDLLIEELPIYKRWNSHPVRFLIFFEGEVFGSICHRVQTAQKAEHYNIVEELSPQQQNFIQREFSKITPKLQVGTRLSQSILSGQRLHQQEIISHLNSLHTKLDWIIENTPGLPLGEAQEETLMVPTSEGLTVAHDTPPRPSPNITTNTVPSSQGCYDQLKTLKGLDRKRAPATPVLNRPFSSSNITARDYWQEYRYGLNGGPSLQSLEATGSKWRSDTLLKRVDGKKGTCLKAAWSMQKPIYEFIERLIDSGKSEDESIELIQEVFDRFVYRHSGKAKLNECKKEFHLLWGGLV
jgi:hypothetical protein